jgi:hypothetical protein
MPHRQRLSPDDYLSKYPGSEFHSHGRGWGTVSKTGKTILWNTYRPLTKRQREAENRRREKRAAWFKTPEGQEYCRQTDKIIDDLFVRAGTTREKVSEELLKVIRDAPPFGS